MAPVSPSSPVTLPEAPWSLIILGAGMAGYRLAREYRQRNADATVLLICPDGGQLLQASAAEMADTLGIAVLNNTRVTEIDRLNGNLETPLGRFVFERLMLATDA